MDAGTALVLANSEFGHCEFGDARRSARAVRIASDLIASVGTPVSSTCGKSGAQAVSRFFDSASVNEESMLGGHRAQSKVRCGNVSGRILALQDTTSLDFSSHSALEGLGPTSTSTSPSGIMMHSVFLSTEAKVPLGVLGLRLWCRNPADHGQKHKRHERHTMEKESAKWLWGLEQVSSHLSDLDKEVVLIGDRESDMYDLFASPRPDNVHLLVRMSQNRAVKTADGDSLMLDALEKCPVLGRYELTVESQNRVARLEVRSMRVWLRAPKNRKLANSGIVTICVVDVREVGAPDGVESLRWILLTTLDANDFESAKYVIGCYSCRWTIEEFHRTLKTGCRVERLQLATLQRLRPAIAMLCVVAQQVMYLTKYARQSPDEPATNVCTQEERDTVERWVRTFRYRTYELVSVRDYVRGIGFVGGFHGRKCDGEPGVKSVWQGIRRLTDLVAGRHLERSDQPMHSREMR
ncbi:MAG: IS4 family transposase [Armatimonadota bacterium]